MSTASREGEAVRSDVNRLSLSATPYFDRFEGSCIR
jgi:hypothetical protein